MNHDMRILMGNEAIAFGALNAGVTVVTGYPGTPSTEVLETVARHNPGLVHVEWSTNEKVALEVAAGASYAGARTLVTMKQVGMNVASDPLMSLSYIGIKGGMVVLVADDPGPISSQTEQDTRLYGKFSKIPVFDPTTPEEAFSMMLDAYSISERYNTPVIMRPTTRICHSRISMSLDFDYVPYPVEGFIRDPKWVIFPQRSYIGHLQMNVGIASLADEFSDYRFNTILERVAATDKTESLTCLYKGNATAAVELPTDSLIRRGILAGGVSNAYVREALACSEFREESYRFATITTPYPFPALLALTFLRGLEEVLVFEELDPVLEENLITLCGAHHLDVKIRGKLTHDTFEAGENDATSIRHQLQSFFNKETSSGEHADASLDAIAHKPDLPSRPPILCAGCPHRGSFYAVKQALKGRKAFFMGDIGCYTLGNAQPLDMVDTCLCMGAGITLAQGMQIVEPDALHIAFVGDSTFFASAIPGIINAHYNKLDITVIVLDNSTTAMTGHQPHPGTGVLMTGSVEETTQTAAAQNHALKIPDILAAIGVDPIIIVDPLDQASAQKAVHDAVAAPQVSAVIFESPCIALMPPKNRLTVDESSCTNCHTCIDEIGCPALTVCTISDNSKQVIVDKSLCYGCGLCMQICPVDAIICEGEDL